MNPGNFKAFTGYEESRKASGYGSMANFLLKRFGL
jgi:hypothetical protein